jgi:signal transduction histidine kinase
MPLADLRAVYSTKSEGSGMGMGLAIARSIVDAHAGRMAAENNDGGGATVWFSVPVSLTVDHVQR